MKKKIKIFCEGCYANLEKEVNSWIEDSNVNVLTITVQDQQDTPDSQGYVVAVIVYESL